MSAEGAKALTEHLLHADGYRGKSPLLAVVEGKVTSLTAEIASEIVAEHPELREQISAKIHNTIVTLLREDTWLQETVVHAVSKAIMEGRYPGED